MREGPLPPEAPLTPICEIMAKGRRNQAIDRELDLPKEIIQHIQSFLNGKQAASTAVLSKSWYNAWLTRPSLDFDERYFQKQDSDTQSDGKFFEFVEKSMERYHELNSSIESFKLWMNVNDIESYSLATELILKALKMGANCIDLEFNPPICKYLLPEEVFAVKSLVGLSVVGCRILAGQIMCSRLKSLRLCKVSVGDEVIRDIMLKCHLIENMFLSDCEGLLKVNLSKMVKLKSFSYIRRVETPLIEFGDQTVGSVIGDRIIVSEFRNLSYLLLAGVKINEMLFCDFGKNFPCVEDLTIDFCSGCTRFDISSNSLKYISFSNMAKLEVQLNVPNIRRFTFAGAVFPLLSLVTSSSKWQSKIAFYFLDSLDVSWFLELKNFLTNLSQSKIFLCMQFSALQSMDFVPHIQDFSKPMVETLVLDVHPFTLDCLALFDGLFWSFRPKVITQYLFSLSNNKSVVTRNEALHLLCKKLMDQENNNFHNSTEKLIGWPELEELKAEFYEDTLRKWRPLPWQSLHMLDAFRSTGKDLKICFRFRWRTP